MKQVENIMIDNIFSQEQIDYIYSVVNATPDENTHVQTRLGHKAWFAQFDDSLRRHLEKIVQDRFGEEWYLNDFQFARYSNSYGYLPKLHPHFDDAFNYRKLTLDVQIKATTEWPIIVEGNEFVLKDNQGLIFSGTHQIHWRPEKVLSDSDQIDMFFCHLQIKDDAPIPQEWKDYMQKREDEWIEKTGITNQEIKINTDGN